VLLRVSNRQIDFFRSLSNHPLALLWEIPHWNLRSPMRLCAAASVVLVLALPTAICAQAPASFRVGLKSIAIPAPPADNLVEAGSDYRVLLEPLATASNRIVAGFLLPDELNALRTGKTSLTRYSLVEVLRSLEFSDVTPDMFKQVGDSTAQQFGTIITGSLKDQQDEINRKLKALGDSATAVTLDKPVPLGTFFSKTDAVSFGMIVPLQVNGQVKKGLVACTLLRVHDRLLFLYTFAPYTGEDSVKGVSASAEKWADAVISANKE